MGEKWRRYKRAGLTNYYASDNYRIVSSHTYQGIRYTVFMLDKDGGEWVIKQNVETYKEAKKCVERVQSNLEEISE